MKLYAKTNTPSRVLYLDLTSLERFECRDFKVNAMHQTKPFGGYSNNIDTHIDISVCMTREYVDKWTKILNTPNSGYRKDIAIINIDFPKQSILIENSFPTQYSFNVYDNEEYVVEMTLNVATHQVGDFRKWNDGAILQVIREEKLRELLD